MSSSPIQNPFPLSEYERRLALVRSRMIDAGLDSLLVSTPENICYLTGYQTFGGASQFLLITPQDEPHFILRDLELALVSATSWFQGATSYRDDADPVTLAIQLVADRTSANAVVGLELARESMPYARAQRFFASGEREFVDGSGIVETARRVKSQVEVNLCRQAAAITDLGIEAALNAAAVGRSENDLAAAAAAAMTAGGSEWFASSPIVTSGPRSGIPHTSYARRTLEDGDTILIEFGANLYRYFGPLMRTIVLGEPSEEAAAMHQTCLEALEAAMRILRPGVTCGEAHAAAQTVIDRDGRTELFKKRLGYSIGIGFKSWMEPDVIMLDPGDPKVVESGMVFHMPPALRHIGVTGVGISETVVVTESGCEPLGRSPRALLTKDASS